MYPIDEKSKSAEFGQLINVGEPTPMFAKMEAQELLARQGARIRDARSKKGWSIEDLAGRTGLHANTVGRIERGQSECSIEQLLLIARSMDARPVDLCHFSDAFKSSSLDDDQFALIEMLDTRTSGGGLSGDYNDVIGRFAFKRRWLERRGLKPETSKLMRHSGKAMADKINHGDVLLVNMAVKSMGAEGIYLIELDGVDDVKLLQRDYTNGGIFLISYNSAFKTVALNSEQAERLRINAEVVWHAEEL